MSLTFPRARRSKRGYSPAEVDAFLSRARAAFEDKRRSDVSAADIRTTAFSMERGGYVTASVDSALERLEDAFASRERDQAMRAAGEQAWRSATRALAKEIIARLQRPSRHRFSRVGVLGVGYSPKDVDAFCDDVRAYFDGDLTLEVEEVRSVAFRPARRGYREAQVDLLIDGLVQVLLAVR